MSENHDVAVQRDSVPMSHHDTVAGEWEARADHRLEALGEMSEGIVHDFRNVLTIVDSALRMVERNSDSPDKVRQYIGGARDGVAQGLELTSRLLTLARQQELLPCLVDVNELLQRLERFLRHGAGTKVRVIMRLAADMPKCIVDVAEFNAAILNLVVNARVAMPDGGQLLISTNACNCADREAVSRTYVRVHVADNGRGMSEETIRHIFDPFFTTKGAQGHGLGLPQVRAFMKRMGGHLNVASEPGVGTAFDLLFPA